MKQRLAIELPARLEFLDQFLERDILVRVSIETYFAHPPQKVAKARLAAQITAQNQSVDEKSDQPFAFYVGTIGHRGTDGDIVLPRVTMQQKLKRRQQRHERRRVLLRSQAIERRR